MAGNTDSSAIWGLSNKEFSSSDSGWKLVEYDAENVKWTIDPTQPVGAKHLTVNSKGMPTFT